jgi:xanthine/uracil permease
VLTLLLVLLAAAALPGMSGRFALLVGVAGGWVVAAIGGALDPQRVAAVGRAGWLGLPEFTASQITPSVVLGMLPVVIVLVAENVGNVRAIGAVTGRDTNGLTGDVLVANGLATTMAGLGGGAGMTVYPQSIGVMAASRVFSTASYAVAAVAAVALSFSPKAAAALLTVPLGVLGGASLVLYGLIGMHGAKVWMDHRVDLTDPVVLMVTAAAVVAGVGNLSVTVGSVQVGGVVWGTAGIMVLYPLLRGLRRLVPARGPVPDVPDVPVKRPRLGGGRPGGVGWQLGQK